MSGTEGFIVGSFVSGLWSDVAPTILLLHVQLARNNTKEICSLQAYFEEVSTILKTMLVGLS